MKIKLTLAATLVAALIGGCAHRVPEIPDQSPCVGYVKTGGKNPCIAVPINRAATRSI